MSDEGHPPGYPANQPDEQTGSHEPALTGGEPTPAPHPAASTPPESALPTLDPSQLPEPPKNWRTQLAALKARARAHLERITQTGWARGLAQRIQEFEPAQAAEWANRTFAAKKTGRPYGKAATIALCAFFLADLAALLAGRFIPEPPVPRMNRMSSYRRPKMVEDYGVVFTRNLFNSQGIIPGEETGQPVIMDGGGAAVRTSLPFNLIGTVILQDETRSIATIEDKSLTTVYPVRQTDEIPSKARITKIEARKVTFVNIATGRNEFVDIPEDGAAPTRLPTVNVGSVRPGAGIEKTGPTQYNVDRKEVDAALKDINKVLTEARAVPNFENGVANGYKLFQIVPGSIYDKLGLQNGDVITGLGGTPINDPTQAISMLTELKNGASHLELQVKRDGRTQNNIYDIR